MHGTAIAAEALGRDGLGLLTGDAGALRAAEVSPAPGEPRAAETGQDGPMRALPEQAMRATRP